MSASIPVPLDARVDVRQRCKLADRATSALRTRSCRDLEWRPVNDARGEQPQPSHACPVVIAQTLDQSEQAGARSEPGGRGMASALWQALAGQRPPCVLDRARKVAMSVSPRFGSRSNRGSIHAPFTTVTNRAVRS